MLRGASPGLKAKEEGIRERDGTLWQRKLQPSTRKQTSGQLLKLSGQGKGSSPRSPWGTGEMLSAQVGEGNVASPSQEPILT